MRFFRGLLIAVIALCVVVAILVVALNLYLGLPSARSQFQARASAALGLDLSFKTLHLNAIKGLTGTSFSIANRAAPTAGVLLAAPAVETTYAPQALLRHRLLVRQIVLTRPVMVLATNGDGNLVAPPRAETPEAASFRGLRVIVKSFNAADGTLRLLAPDGGGLLSVEGATVGGRLGQSGGSWQGSGQFSAKSLALGPFPAANLQGGYDFAEGVYKFTKVIGTTCHGQLAGSFQLATHTSGTPGDFQVQGSALDLNELLKSAFARPDLLSGSLDFNASGHKAGIAWTAQGSLDARDGQLIHIDFIDELAAALGVKELSQPDFSAAHVDFSLDQGVATLSGLELKGASFELTGSGTVALADGTAKLDLQLALSADAAKQLTPAVAAQLAPGEDGAKTLRFSVTGPLDHLKTAPPVHF